MVIFNGETWSIFADCLAELLQVNTCYNNNCEYQHLIYCIAYYETKKDIINKVTISPRSLKVYYYTVCLLDEGYRTSLTG